MTKQDVKGLIMAFENQMTKNDREFETYEIIESNINIIIYDNEGLIGTFKTWAEVFEWLAYDFIEQAV